MLEQQLEKDHIYLTCRHNIYELGLNFFFEACVTTSVGPKTGLFERFRPIQMFKNNKNIKNIKMDLMIHLSQKGGRKRGYFEDRKRKSEELQI